MPLEAFWIPPALAGLYVWWRIVQNIRPDQDGVVPSADYRLGDGIFASVLAAYFLLGILAPDPGNQVVTTDLLITGTVMYSVLVLLVYSFLVLRRQDVRVLFGLGQLGWRTTFRPALIGIVSIYPTVLLLTWLSRVVLGKPDGNDATIDFLLGEPGPAALALAGSVVIVVAPIAEEFIFRGLLYGVAKKFGGRIPALVTTSLLFAAIHLNPVAMVPLFVLSVAFTLAYERTGSLWTPVVMHVIFNGAQFLAILLFPEWTQ
ncbi:MAG: CPBP family intramembrane glutamic endopeptidase [Chthoniobacterales bacterium]